MSAAIDRREEALPASGQPLREQIDRVEAKLGGLSNDLRAIDGQLLELMPKREQFELVQNVCDSLERLRELGVSSIFWGDKADESQTDRHVEEVRGRLGKFTEQINVIEAKRQALLDEIKQGYNVLHLLEGDLFEVQEEEDERNREWIVEREAGPIEQRPQRMPWSRLGEDDQRFAKSLRTTLLVAVLAGLIVPLVPMPQPEPEEAIELPERVVRFIELEHRVPLPPAPVPEEKKPEEPKPEPEQVADQKAAEPAPVEAPAPKPEPAPRERAEAAGILAFRESLATIAERRPAAQLGSAARVSNAGAGDNRMPTRSLVTSLAPGSSGGINLASISRQVGGDGGGGGNLAGVEAGRVESTIGGGTGPGGAGAGERAWAGGAAGRTDEEIQIVFDRYKASLYRLYNRELRNNPTLRGQMVLRLTIEPNGSVSFLELQSTDMNAPALVQQVLDRVRVFDFGAKDVAAITIVYPIDFLPAA
ncbi:MAG TPA: AgmX/PglI C-terminal domain-containing protein [Gammaproteobacteria bacterium]